MARKANASLKASNSPPLSPRMTTRRRLAERSTLPPDSNGLSQAPKEINAGPILENPERSPRSNGRLTFPRALGMAGAMVHATFPEWIRLGLLITLVQFLLVAVTGYYDHFSTSHPPFFVRPNRVPIRRWLIYVLLFASVNLLNNYAFGFRISVPVHIILRSGGSVTTMLVGALWGKRYSRMQVVAVALLTVGVIVAAMADARAQGKPTNLSPDPSTTPLSTFTTGLLILLTAQLLSAVMGLYIQRTYEIHGSAWRENLFYSHMLSLPLFLPFLPALRAQFDTLVASPPLTLSLPPISFLNPKVFPNQQLSASVPTHVALLALNALTQYACIRGVNLLSARASALTVTIVLNVRKLASLLLSIALFGNRLAPGVLVGATVVFAAGALYAWEGQRVAAVARRRRLAEGDKEGRKKA
ncbi:MAG: golgi uridine diphosphate-N- acetylglucosamine transporter [Piccolia ochrophora]|nr:MAG: golgi uridine diphosphate-N- acetylglucosamine transporter [Piccolia ochrophora]